MKQSVFCSRKGGATINGKFYAAQRTSQILAKQLEDKNKLMEFREIKRQKRAGR